MDSDDPEKRIADLERQLAEQTRVAQPELPQGGAVPRPGLTADDVRKVVFSAAAVRERGYNQDEVDAFLDRVEAALQDQSGHTLTPEQVRTTAFSKPRIGSRGYAEADVDAFLDLLESELSRRAGEQPAGYPEASGSRYYGATTPVPQPAVSTETGSDESTKSRGRGLGISDLGWGLVYVVTAMFDDTSGVGPNWVIPAWGVILTLIGVVVGRAGHGWHTLWVGIAFLAVSAIYLAFKLIRALVWKSRGRGQSTSGRHSAG